MTICHFTKCPTCSLDKTAAGQTNSTSTLNFKLKHKIVKFLVPISNANSVITVWPNWCIVYCDMGGHGPITNDDTTTGCLSVHNNILHIYYTCCQCCQNAGQPSSLLSLAHHICLSHQMLKQDNCMIPLGEWSIAKNMMFGEWGLDWVGVISSMHKYLKVNKKCQKPCIAALMCALIWLLSFTGCI